ncbi:hypothetical protein D3C84_891250 [compost metagenome]
MTGGAHVIAGGVHQVRFGLDEVVAPVSGDHVRYGQDQAGTPQPLQVGGSDLAEWVVAHTLGPGQLDGGQVVAVTGTVHEHLYAIRCQVDQIGGAGAVEIGQ